MKYTKVKREDSICNICQNTASLSWDHVPPKGGIDLSSMEVRNYKNSNFSPNSPNRDIMQNGLKFRTICNRCNSQLGSLYDISFNQFIKDAFSFAQTKLYIPQTILIKTSPTKIIKSLLGHLLATKTDNCNGELDILTREYLFNENAILSKEVHIYCWYYPYDCTIIRNDICQVIQFPDKYFIYSIIKTFPLAFAISLDDNLHDLLIDSTEITKYNCNNENELKSIPIRLMSYREWDFPEALKFSSPQLIYTESNDIFAIKKR